MSKSVLPIDVIPNTDPPRFQWRQVIDTPVGKHVVDQEGILPPSVEGAVVLLIEICKQQIKQNAVLTAQLEAKQKGKK